MSQYRCAVINHPDGAWRDSLQAACHDLIDAVKAMLAEGPVAFCVLDNGGAMIEKKNFVAGQERVVPEYGFWDARDLAVLNGWMEAGTGRWLASE